MKEAVHRIPGVVLIDHTFDVPLDHDRPSGETIRVFAREAVASGRETEDLPWLVYLQGGPGFPAPRPTARSGWLKRALQDYRVLLLDQRGTGRSTPLTAQTLAARPTPEDQAAYLRNFRADAIVRDAEAIRRELVGPDRRWTVLGQSYGGFCALRYLCAAPAGLAGALFAGGLPPIDRPVDEVYRATYRRVIEKNERFYERYPDDVARTRAVVDALLEQTVSLPGGDRLTPRRFQQLGIGFGASDGFEPVHYLLEEAFIDDSRGRALSETFLWRFENAFSFQTNPLYAVLHEAIYAQEAATRWSAERIRSEYPVFDASAPGSVYFTGEMIYPWMFDEYRGLRPLRAAAEILAETPDWPRLYDREALGQNEVPCAAAVYYHDMYVERAFSEETAAAVRGLRIWVTSEYEHNGLRAEGETVLGRLLDLLHGRA